MIEKRNEYYAIDLFDEVSNRFTELCRGDNLEKLESIYKHILSKEPNKNLRIVKEIHIEQDYTETIKSSF